MAIETAVRDRLDPSLARLSPEEPGRTKAPVRVWAVCGVLIAAFEIYVLAKWVTGPYFKSVPAGPTPVPEAMKVGITAITIFGFVVAPVLIYRYVVAPWRREGRLTSEALMLIWFGTLAWFYDPFANFFSPYFTWNSWGWNRGSWVAEIPGWHSIAAGSPGRTMAYPMLAVPFGYLWALFAVAMLCVWVMRKTKARFPDVGALGLMTVCFLFGTVFFFVLEAILVRTGIYGYHAAIPSLTVWYGHYYQLPIYESVLSGVYFTGYASLLYFRNDKGHTIAERGIERLSLGRRSSTAVRFFALAAAGTAIYMFTYNIPYWIITQYHEPWPRDVQTRSYMTDFICGPSTNQACPTRDLPAASRGQIHFDPQGRLIVPPGEQSPNPASAVTFNTK